MGDWRRYSGTQTLQVGWTVLAFLLTVVAAVFVEPALEPLSLPVVLVGGSGLWIVGLVLLGLRERQYWNQMVAASSFERDRGTRSADLEKLLGGRSVVVTTDVPGLVSQTHTEIRTTIEGVDASFTIRIEHVGTGGGSRGVRIDNEKLDESFVFEGSEQNVGRLLSPDVQAALMDIETPGVWTVTGNRATYEVPFTRLSTSELEAISDTAVLVAERIEELGRG